MLFRNTNRSYKTVKNTKKTGNPGVFGILNRNAQAIWWTNAYKHMILFIHRFENQSEIMKF